MRWGCYRGGRWNRWGLKWKRQDWNSFYCSLLGWLCWACQEHPWWKEQSKHGSPVSVVIILGGFSPWGLCLQSWVVWVRCHNIPPISHGQLLPENAPTECSVWVWKSHSQCSSCLFPELLWIFVLQELCEAGRNPPPSTAVKVLICLSQEKPSLFILGYISYQEAVAKLEGLQRTAAVTEMKELGNSRRLQELKL